MYPLYNGLLLLASVGALPYFALKSLRATKYRAGLRQRFGSIPLDVVSALRGTRPLWLHAVSVGEVIAAVPLVNALRGRFPGLPILVSTVTETGQATAREKMAADACLYFPLDYVWVVRQVIARLQPRLFLMVETELWPNFLRELAQQEIPAMLVNGRLSPRSFRGYRRLRPFMRQVLRPIAILSMQTKLDADRIIAIGAEPSRVHVTGNIKYDLRLTPLSHDEVQALRAELGIDEAPVFMAGSTHRGEEEIAIEAYLRARAREPTLRLLLAPRHLDRLDEIEALLHRHQLTTQRRSRGRLSSHESHSPVLLLDTIGELAKLYAVGTVVFVGGSFVPVGGHNVLEPAAHRKAILFGPHMHNFHQIAAALLEAGGALQTQTPEALSTCVDGLLQQPERRQALGDAAYRVLRDNQGALARTLELIDQVLSRHIRT
ncbi:MAG TPA: 3-deoxy-D-manno-octulosonic acid transferase [Candidatus Tectomicrobia bacterium]|nr:3-deoxy-D-manno-octulosonic acid transferase [Candidatus Tectomicrobia bacterium]